MSAVPLPPSWSEARDPTSGRPYYYNTITNETSWTIPTPPPQPVTPTPPASQPVSQSQPASKTALPPGWEEGFDPSSGRVFYIDHNNKITSWTPPVSASVRPPQTPSHSTGISQSLFGGPTSFPSQPLSASWVAPGTPVPSPFSTPTPSATPLGTKTPLVSSQVGGNLLLNMPFSSGIPTSTTTFNTSTNFLPSTPSTNPSTSTVATFPFYSTTASENVIQPQFPVGPPTLSSSKPTWTVTDQPTCVKCKAAFGIWKRKYPCSCCTRAFCDGCCSKKARIGSLSAQPSRVCDSCSTHLTKNDPRCVSRLVPYLAEEKDTRPQAIQEIAELIQVNGLVPAEDIVGIGLLNHLKTMLNSPQGTTVVKILLSFAKKDSPVMASLCEPTFTNALFDAINAAVTAENLDYLTSLGTLVLRVAEIEKGVASINAVECTKACSKMLEISDEQTVQLALQILEKISEVDGKGKAAVPEDLESILVFTIVPFLGAKFPMTVSYSLSVLKNYVRRNDRCKVAFDQAGGIKILSEQMPKLIDNNLCNALLILVHLSQYDQCLHSLMETMPALFPIIAHATGNVQHLCLSVILNLSRADATQQNVNQALVLDHMGILVGLLSSRDPSTQHYSLELLVSVHQSHSEIFGDTLRDVNAFPLLFNIARGQTAVKLTAIRLLAMSTQNNEKNAEIVTSNHFLEILLSIANSPDPAYQLEAIQALWCVTAHVTLRKAFAQEEIGLKIVVQLMSSMNTELKIYLCGVLSNVLVERQCLDKAIELNLVNMLASSLTTQVEDLQVQLLRVLEVMSVDERVRDMVSKSGLITMIFTMLNSKNPAVTFRCSAALSHLVQSLAVRTVIIKTGNLQPLIGLLSVPDANIKERVAKALSLFTVDDNDRAYLRAAHGIAAFVELLFTNDLKLQKHAATAIANFAFAGTQDCGEVLKLGAVLTLVGLLGGDASETDKGEQPETPETVEATTTLKAEKDEVRAISAFALGNLCADEGCRNAIYSEGGLGFAIGLLHSSNPQVVQQALYLLTSLAAHPAVADDFGKANGFNQLTELISSTDQRLRENALKLATVLSNESNWPLMSAAVGVKGLLSFLSSSNLEAQKKAIEMLSKLSENPEEMERLIAANAIPLIVNLLASPNESIQESAVSAVAHFSASESTWGQIIDFGGVNPLVSMIGPKFATKSLSAVTALAQLTRATVCHKTVVEAGGLPKLVGELSSPNVEIRLGALKTLTNMLQNTEFATAVLANGGSLALALLLSSTDPSVRGISVFAVGIIASNPAIKNTVLSDDFFAPIVKLIQQNDDAMIHRAVEILHLVAKEPQFPSAVERSNALDPLVVVFSRTTEYVEDRERILEMLCILCKMPKNRDALAVHEFMDPLLAELKSLSSGASLPPAILIEIISYLVYISRGREIFLDGGWMPFLLSGVKDVTSGPIMEHSVHVIAELCVSEKGREAFHAADGFAFLSAAVLSQEGTTLIHALNAVNCLLAEEKSREWLLNNSLIVQLAPLISSNTVHPLVIHCIMKIMHSLVILGGSTTAATLLERGVQEAIIQRIPAWCASNKYAAYSALDCLHDLLYFEENKKAALRVINAQWVVSVPAEFTFQAQQVARILSL
ncbi:vacuolar protein [Pelomyxa schiedti]|nr:vacuolar protein [Pelomyxa schiedti]